jgi:hypothetical protein
MHFKGVDTYTTSLKVIYERICLLLRGLIILYRTKHSISLQKSTLPVKAL